MSEHDKKQIPALPPLNEAPADDDRFVLRDTSTATDVSLRVDRLLERSAEQVDTGVGDHAAETGGVHGIPEGERALHTGDGVGVDANVWNFTEMPEVDGNPIVARGSNSDGDWTAWADGTLIVAATGQNTLNELEDFREVISGGLYAAAFDEDDFPMAFSSPPPVACSSREYLALIRFGSTEIRSYDATSYRCFVARYGSQSSSAEYAQKCIAKGRWFE